VLAELGRCEFVGRAWEGASVFAEPDGRMQLCWQSLDFYERYVAGVDLLDGWIGTARNASG